MSPQSPIRLLLVDDHQLFRESLANSLNEACGFEVVHQCGTVAEALETVHRTAIDVVLLDLDLGEQQGGAFLNHFRQVGCKSKVLVVTAGVGSREAAWLKNRGCSGIFLKHEPLSKLLGEIRAIFVGVEPEPEGPGEPPEAVRSQRQRALTAREREVLRAVCEGLSNKMIGSRLGVTENSIKSMIQQLFAKTGVRTRAQLVRAAIEQYWNELEPD